MSSPMNLNISSEIIAAQSALNVYPENYENSENNQKNYISEIYPEAIQAMEYLNESYENECENNLLLAKESLEKIKHLEYMIEHSIEHIESALSLLNKGNLK